MDTIQWSNARAKLSACTNTASTAEATVPATRVSFHRAMRMPTDRAASEHEYRFRMLVATGPCMISSRIGTAMIPKDSATRLEGSVPPPALARQAPSAASHTVGTYMPSAVDQNTDRSEAAVRTKRL
ncbi:hypothetical protein LUX33_02060 [Actinomadura madurae]|nr:hypothetical protein [Actinomadura madurae]MCP9947373.1 hypothetical protein [Actinomadura madurae]MCP9976613.1 hypothetical protein [Actinomadura madurae]MCQ0011894.1 hypothetical protein [Actinomadura madurae]